MLVSVRACGSKRDLSIASVDSVMEFGTCAFLQRRKGNFLYSAATTQSMIDYSRKALEDGIVDSPPNRDVVPVAVNSPSPLRSKASARSLESRWRESNGAQRNLYGESSPPPNCRKHLVHFHSVLSLSP